MSIKYDTELFRSFTLKFKQGTNSHMDVKLLLVPAYISTPTASVWII